MRTIPGAEVLDVEFDAKRESLRIFVDSPNGVDHTLCTEVTRVVHEALPDLMLEVSSPGENRPLRYPRHFEQVRGSDVRIRVRGSKRPFIATVVEVDDEAVTVRRMGTDERVLYANIARSTWQPAALEASTPRRQR